MAKARRRELNTIPGSLAQWPESDPDLAIGISVCSHIITRADGYKFTSNTMAIHHRDIIKVMPIAPVIVRCKRRISPSTHIQISPLKKRKQKLYLIELEWFIRKKNRLGVMTERHKSFIRVSDYVRKSRSI